MLKRNISSLLEEALLDTPALFINGARQSGKSTLVKMLTQKFPKTKYVTLDDPTMLEAATTDPVSFLNGLGERVIIDEAQRAPEIFLPIKKLIDEKREPGQFLLTGSANILTLPKISESLAGRIEIHTLWPFSQGELKDHKETFIDTVFSNQVPNSATNFKWEEICNILVKGGFPEILKRNSSRRLGEWFKSYLISILQKDIRDLANIENLIIIPRLLELLANRAANLLNFADVSRVSGITATTLKRYMALLETVFLIVLLPAWFNNREKRLVKAPKVYLNDSGLLCYLHQVNENALLHKPSSTGAILENFVVMELIKQSTWSDVAPKIYHFRTQTGREVDIVLEGRDGRVVGIEVKTSSSLNVKDFAGLQALAETAGHKFHRGIILYTGEQVTVFAPNLMALPLAALWEW